MNFLKDSKTRDGFIKVIIQIIAFFFFAEAFVISLNAVKQLCGLWGLCSLYEQMWKPEG